MTRPKSSPRSVGKRAEGHAAPSPRGERRILGEAHAPGSPAVRRTPSDMVTVWPHLLFREVLAALATVVVLAVIALLFNAPLEQPADPTLTPNPAKAPWYFVGLQELLTYFDPWIAGVMIPAIIIIGLCAIPYIDPTRHGQGVYAVRERPWASGLFLAGLVGWFALIAVGLWFRGPGWSWVWPWTHGAHGVTTESARVLPNLIGIPLVIAYFAAGGWWIVRRTAAWPGFTPARRWTFALLLLAMGGTLIKIVIKLIFGIQYVVSFPGVGFNL